MTYRSDKRNQIGAKCKVECVDETNTGESTTGEYTTSDITATGELVETTT